jgi:hypothetical protein
MDYAGANANSLYKYQWDYIHNPQKMIGLLQDDEEGERVLITDFSKLVGFAVDGWLTFLTPGGTPLSIKLDKLQELYFATSKDEDFLFDLPIGTLARFKYDDVLFKAKKTPSNKFTGYGEYNEDFSTQKKYKNVLGGINCLKDNDIIFKIFSLPVYYKEAIPLKNTGQGDIKDEMHYAYAYNDAFNNSEDAVEIYAKFLSGEDKDEVNFLIQYTNTENLCGTEAFYAFKIVSLLEKHKTGLFDCMGNIDDDVDYNVSKMASNRAHNYLYNSFNSDRLQVNNKNQIYEEAYNTSYESIVAGSYMRFYYSRLVEYINALEEKFDGVSSLSDEKVKSIISFLNIQSYNMKNCMLGYIKDEIKFELIKKLALGTDFHLTDRKERLIIDLISEIEDPKWFLEKLQNEERVFFWDLLEDFDWTGAEYDQLIAVLTTMYYNTYKNIQISSPIITQVSSVSSNEVPTSIAIHKNRTFGHSGYLHTVNTSKEKLESPPRLKITSTHSKKLKDEDHSSHAGVIIKHTPTISGVTATGNLMSSVKVTFSSSFQILGPDGKPISTRDEYIVPMFWLKWFLDEQESIEDAASLRVMLNLGFIGVAVVTLNPSPLLYMELVLGTADIIVAINEDQIRSEGSVQANNLLDAYNNLMVAYGIVVVPYVGVQATKNLYSFTTKTPFSKKLASSKNSMDELADLSSSVRKVFTKTVNAIGKDWKGYNAWKTFQESVYFEAELYRMAKRIRNYELSVEQANKVVVKLLDPAGKIAKEAPIGVVSGDINKGTIVLSNLAHYDETIHGARAPNAEGICTLENVVVADGTNTYTKSYRVFDGAHGSMYVVELIETGSEISSALRKTITNVLSKTQADELIAELGRNADLRAAMETNQALVEGWKTIKYCGDDELAKLATNVDELTDVSKHLDDINEVGYTTWKATKPTRLVEGKNIFRASSQEYSLAKKSFKEYREGIIYEQSKILSGDDLTAFMNEFNGKNLAKVEGQLDGVSLNTDMRISGERFKGEQIFDSYKVDKTGGINTDGAWSREWDTEYVMLSEIAKSKGAVKGGVYPNVTGEIKIISELPYCVSCQGVIQDFSNMFPKVDIILIDALK